jgi:hypothetical protein
MSKRRGHKAQVVSALKKTNKAQAEFQVRANPQSGAGDRNLDRGHYEACLDVAVLQEWESFNCKRCELKNQVAPPPDKAMEHHKMLTEL